MAKYHYNMIVTKKKNILEVLYAKEYDILKAIIFCIYAGPTHSLYDMNLLATSMNLYTINTLIYKGKDGYKKLSKRRYEIELFEGFAETLEEVETIIQRLGFSPTQDEVKHVYSVF